mmetsp:Transcript_21244/g.35605  ORF Transcript_21244/g.35605 Transcript_21244/m.35605 type:complete len:276 (+) Transcript_21244:516-1343(+)
MLSRMTGYPGKDERMLTKLGLVWYGSSRRKASCPWRSVTSLHTGVPVQHQRKREESPMHALDCATSGFLILCDSSSRMRCHRICLMGEDGSMAAALKAPPSSAARVLYVVTTRSNSASLFALRMRFCPWYMWIRSGVSSLLCASSIHWPTSDTAHTTSVAFEGTTSALTILPRLITTGSPGIGGGSVRAGLARMSASTSTVLPRPMSSHKKPPVICSGTKSTRRSSKGEYHTVLFDDSELWGRFEPAGSLIGSQKTPRKPPGAFSLSSMKARDWR